MPSLWRVTFAACLVESFLLSRLLQQRFIQSFVVLLPAHLVLAALWKIVLWPLLFSPLRKLPEPEGASFINGHSRLLPDERSGIPMSEWINDIPNDGLIRYRVKLNKERLFLTSPKGLSEVLVQKNYDFAKPYTLRLGLGRILGVGLIIAEGDEHKKQRRQLMPAFSHRHIKNLYPTFWSKSVELARTLSSVVEKDSASGNGQTAVVDIAGWLARTTLDIIGVAGMGQEFNAIHNPDNEICNAYASVFDQPPPKSKLVILKLVAQELAARLFPIKRTDRIAIASATLKEVGRRLMQEKQKIKNKTGKLGEKDIISVALDSGAFTEDMLVNQVMTFLAAGHETTATSMTWAVLALCQNPSVQTKLREEVRAHLPSIEDCEAAAMTPELLDSLPYLHAVCNEVLRVYPPAGLTKRVAVKDTTILGQPVPAGTDIVIVMRAINHSKELWGEDATEFKPQRWLGPGRSNSGGADSNFSYMTFLHGPRSCIGQGFAKAEFASLLAVLVGCFEMEVEDSGRPVEIETGLTSKPKGGLKVRLRRVPGW